MGINCLLTLLNVKDRSLSVSFLLKLEFLFCLEKSSNPPRLAGKRITKPTIKIIPPPNQATIARQRLIDLDNKSSGNTCKPVVVKTPTISRYASMKSMPGTIIQVGTAKNKGRSKNKRIKEITCITPVSLRFLFEVARLIKERTRIPVNPVYKKTLASKKDSTRNA